MLAPSSFLASAMATLSLQNFTLASSLVGVDDTAASIAITS